MEKFIGIIKKYKSALFVAILIPFFLISAVCFFISNPGKKYVMYFPSSGTEKNTVEIRYVKNDGVRERLQIFIDELLLGPSVPRAKYIFPLGTKASVCFERDGILYLNLSEEALLDFSDISGVEPKFALLEKNIKKNFGRIKEILFFIDGNQVNANISDMELKID